MPAFKKFVNRYERHMWTLAQRMLRHRENAEDVTQETFLIALERLNELRDEGRFWIWQSGSTSHWSNSP